ncbi:MAG: disulfide bond formation protein B [Halorhodospira sp.]
MADRPMPWQWSGRWLLGGVVLLGAAAGGITAGAEYWGGLEPCALCWTQRGILALLTVVALLGVLLWPRRRWGRWLLGGALAATVLAGVLAAGRHLYVMANPGQVDCGMSPEVMLQMLPWQEALLALVTGSTSCAEAAALLGVPLPVASLATFAALGVLSAYALTRPR